jgi:glycosyltransferase involved in cell wall biosynthesis
VCIKLAINARFLTQRVTGVQRYARELTAEILTILGQDRVLLFSPAGSPEEYAGALVKQAKSPARGHAWEQLVLPFMVKGSESDILWSPGNAGPLLVGEHVLTIHDAAVFAHPEGFNPLFRRWYAIVLPLLAKRVKRIITVSEFSRRDIVRYLNVNEKKVSVIPNGISSIFKQLPSRTILDFKYSNELPERFILALGSKGYNKNYQRLLQAWEIIAQKRDFEDLWLITVGGKVNTLAGGRVSAGPQYSRVVDLGYVEDWKLPLLYNAAEAFIFPSLYEGFGLPPLEAMACGCPVVVSNMSSLPESCGDAAFYCDPYNPQDIAKKVKILLSYGELKKKMAYRGLRHTKRFTWNRCAHDTIAVIEKVLEK